MKPKQYETKKDYILESLKDRILSGTFGPGFHLKTRQIAEEYGTSEIPVREALSQLASMGLVRIIPHVGAITSTLSSHDLKEIFQIRETLESLAVRLAVPQLTDDDINQITDIAQALEKAVTEGAAPDRLNYLNRQFHTQIYQHCDNQRLIHIKVPTTYPTRFKSTGRPSHVDEVCGVQPWTSCVQVWIKETLISKMS